MDKSWNPLKLSLKKWSNNHETVQPPFPLSSYFCLYSANHSSLCSSEGNRNVFYSAKSIRPTAVSLFCNRFITRVRNNTKNNYLIRHICLSVCLSVRPRGTARLPLDRFSLNMIFGSFSEISRENSSFISGCFPWRPTYVYENVLPIMSFSDKSCS